MDTFVVDDELENTTNTAAGVNFYLVSVRWWEQMIEARRMGIQPPPIDNSSLCMEGTQEEKKYVPRMDPNNMGWTKQSLRASVDFHVVPEDLWIVLLASFGGGPSFRRVTRRLIWGPTIKFEVYPLSLQVFTSPEKGSP